MKFGFKDHVERYDKDGVYRLNSEEETIPRLYPDLFVKPEDWQSSNTVPEEAPTSTAASHDEPMPSATSQEPSRQDEPMQSAEPTVKTEISAPTETVATEPADEEVDDGS